jgi:hypothetical protein
MGTARKKTEEQALAKQRRSKTKQEQLAKAEEDRLKKEKQEKKLFGTVLESIVI